MTHRNRSLAGLVACPSVLLAVFFLVGLLPQVAGGQQPRPPGTAAGSADRSQITAISEQEFQLRSRPLLDAQSLAGWEGNAYWFTLEDAAVIAGRLEEPIPKSQFLCTTETFGNFDLRLEVRMRGDEPNAGVQFRSRRPRAGEQLPAHEVIGYQADMGRAWGRSVWGALYDESRRNKMLAEPQVPFDIQWTTPVADDPQPGPPEQPARAASEKAVPETPWVRMRIVCYDDQIEIFLNDTLTVRYTETDPEIPRVGAIGLQIHSGPPAEAWYRNIRILSLRPQDVRPNAVLNPGGISYE